MPSSAFPDKTRPKPGTSGHKSKDLASDRAGLTASDQNITANDCGNSKDMLLCRHPRDEFSERVSNVE
jgi:hypothetical protein